MADHKILGYTNPIGSECSPLITIIVDKYNNIKAQFPDSSIKLLALKNSETYKDIKGIILAEEELWISSNEYSYIDHSNQIHTLPPKEMLKIISKDLDILKNTDIDLYELLEFFFLQEKEQLSSKRSTVNVDFIDTEIIPTIVTRKKAKKLKKQIIIRPVISEKTGIQSDRINNPKYTFEVDKKANKIEIKKAVELFFGVSVEKVNTLIVPSKTIIRNTRSGVIKGKKSGYKKAVITLNHGEYIDFYNGLNLEKVA